MQRPKRKKISRPQKQHRVLIQNLAQGGDGVARDERGRVLFIPGALPGEEVLAVELSSKKKFARAKLLSVLTPAEERVTPPCPHDALCGGCDLLHAHFDAQLPLKAQAAWETIWRISGIRELPEHIELLAAPAQGGWRTRATIRARRLRGQMEVGLLERGSHRIVPMQRCMMLVEPLHHAMIAVREVLDAQEELMGASFFIELAHPEDQVVVTFEEVDGEANPEQLLEHVQRHDMIRGARWRVEGHEPRDVGCVTVQAGVVFGRCPERLEKEELPAGMFRQAHATLSAELVDLVLAQFEGVEASRVLELFSGCGNFTFALIEHGVTSSVLAMEAASEAVEVGQRLVESHGFADAVSFECVDLYEEGWKARHDHGRWPVVLLDPPRSGAKQVCEVLASDQGVEIIVYVACDPASLARDMGVLHQGGFMVEQVAMADMFPGTGHVETVVRLRRA